MSIFLYYLIYYIHTSKHTLFFTINYYNCLFVKSLTRTFWFVWFLPIFQLYLHKLPYLEMCTNHVYSFFPPFSDFLAIFLLATLFGNVHKPHQHYLYMSMIVYIISIIFFCSFMIFQLYLHKLPYLKMCTDHINHTSALPITVHIVSIIFPHFEAIFAFITIFRNAHSLHQHNPKTVNSILDHVYSFFLIFHDFSAIFISITIFGKVHRPCKQYPNIVTHSHDQHHPPNNPLHKPWQTKSSWSCFP